MGLRVTEPKGNGVGDTSCRALACACQVTWAPTPQPTVQQVSSRPLRSQISMALHEAACMGLAMSQLLSLQACLLPADTNHARRVQH